MGRERKNKDKEKEAYGYLYWSNDIDDFKSKDGGNHEMYYKKKGNDFQLYVASKNPKPILEKLEERKIVSRESKDRAEEANILTAQQYYNQEILPLENELENLKATEKNSILMDKKLKSYEKRAKIWWICLSE
ncbi:hypothetical protein [Chryseobacterium cheonjiense]|uniref:Uncharacterized protein n=1 Tax=Chryseobacterium cheonjiense TaxID=2728845 RepID=A0A7Y0A6Q0_9FLAO|nr:hypothetical protein [Chryseobacterium cheonjiense]NML57712.1 hypothetical protein [Chryseobacterium cheonjiense]